jgi:imidazolonepropionase-like amidohydrolase
MTHRVLFHPTGIEQGDARTPSIMAKVRDRSFVEQTIKRVHDANLRIALGTDSMHGLFGYEMQWLVEHGWSELDALIAGTRHGGEILDDPTAGVLRPGSRADFVALRRDPLLDITAVFDMAAVFLNWQRVASDGVVLAPTPPHSTDTVTA